MASGVRSMKLYHCPASRSARALWALKEAVGDDFDLVRVNLYRGEQYHPDYVAKNPNHNVPLLEIEFTDGISLKMKESAAMVSWIADAFPVKGLAPAPGLTRARADYCQMLQFGASPMDMMLWQIRVHEHLLADTVRDERTTERYRKKFRAEVEPQLLERIAKHDYICGDEFTAADIVIGHNVGWAAAYGLCADDAFRKYQLRLARRPAFLAAFADAAEFPIVPPFQPSEASPFNG